MMFGATKDGKTTVESFVGKDLKVWFTGSWCEAMAFSGSTWGPSMGGCFCRKCINGEHTPEEINSREQARIAGEEYRRIG